MVSSAHAVCSRGLYIAMISTTVETNCPEDEIRPAVDLLGDVLEMFVQVTDMHMPVNDSASENLHVTQSYDATSHFETASLDVLEIYERIMGEKLDMNIDVPDDLEEY